MLTPERLREIKERCERATEGPWRWAEWEEGAFGRPGKWVEPNPEAPLGRLALLNRENRRVIEWDELDGIVVGEADREFVANAREDVPALVAEVEAYWALKDELRKLIQFFRDRADELRKLARAEAEDERDEALLSGHADGLIEAADALEETLKELEAIRSAE